MKTLPVIASVLLMGSWAVAKEIQWTHAVEDGEDATSTFYYFYLSNGERISHVRVVWNGGAQNPPTVTDYLVDGGKITVRKLEGTRADVATLVAGKEAGLKVKSEYSIETSNSSRMLLPPAPDKSLTEGQRVDIGTLIHLLAMDRKPVAPK